MINEHEIIAIHLALHDESLHHVQHRGLPRMIRNYDTGFKLYREVVIREFLVLTQNLRKASSHSSWILKDPVHRRLTWVIDRSLEHNAFVGEVRQVGPDIKVYLLEGRGKRIEVRRVRVPWDEDGALLNFSTQKRR